jgi:ATP-dependent DNA helicase DinG
VVVATHSKVLQNQILTTIPELEPSFGEVRATLVKGRENYISLEALDDALDGIPSDPDDALALAIIVGWVSQTPTGDWDDLRTWAIERNSPALTTYKSLLRVDESEGVATTKLERAGFHRRAVLRMEDADLAILNHAVLIRRKGWLEQPEENRVLIIDEAHNLEESATAALSESLTSSELAIVLDGVHTRQARSGFLRRYADATGHSLKGAALASAITAIRDCRTSFETLSESLVAYVADRAGARRATIEKYGTSYRVRPGLDTARPAYSGVRTSSTQLATALRSLAVALDDLEIPETLRRRYRRRRLENEKARLARRLREAAQQVALDAQARARLRRWWSRRHLEQRPLRRPDLGDPRNRRQLHAPGEPTGLRWPAARAPVSIREPRGAPSYGPSGSSPNTSRGAA